MVRGSGRGFASRLTAAAVATALTAVSCSATPGSTSVPTTTATTVEATTSTTIPSSSTTTTRLATTTTEPVTTSTVDLPDVDLEVLVPDGEGPFPAAVLVHGGGWVGGSPLLMSALARFLTAEGYLTVNTAYTLSIDRVGYPAAVDDVACAVRYAAAHPDGDGTVVAIGHSAGAHLSALVALDNGLYGGDCPLEEPVVPDRLVGLAGPYDVARLGPLLLPFFGAGPTEIPDVWQAGNPLRQAGNNPGLSSLLLHGEEDVLVDLSFATDFADALTAAGAEALVEIVAGAGHNDLQNPDLVGDLIISWLER